MLNQQELYMALWCCYLPMRRRGSSACNVSCSPTSQYVLQSAILVFISGLPVLSVYIAEFHVSEAPSGRVTDRRKLDALRQACDTRYAASAISHLRLFEM